MQSIVLEIPGRLLAAERPEPSPGPGEALVRVHSVGICGTDIHAFAGRQPFFSYPRILGHELGVEVLDPGDDPQGLKPGDRCCVEPHLNCGTCIACRRGKPNCCTQLKVMGVHVDGGMRPLVTLPARKLHRSDKLDYDQLAFVETLSIGAHAVERSAAGPDDFAVVIGAGPIGLSVVQILQARGTRFAVLDTSDARLEFCRGKLGVAHLINPSRDSAPDRLAEIGGGDMPTIVFDATGSVRSMQTSFELPSHGGKLVFVGLAQGDITFNDPAFHRRELTLMGSRNSTPEDIRSIIATLESGRMDTASWITHRLSLPEVPSRFAGIARDPALVKAIISV